MCMCRYRPGGRGGVEGMGMDYGETEGNTLICIERYSNIYNVT